MRSLFLSCLFLSFRVFLSFPFLSFLYFSVLLFYFLLFSFLFFSEHRLVIVTGVTMKSQKEITLAKDLQLRDRQDIYRNFLLYCMSGDTIALPMGSTVVVERDQTEFARLSQLGDVLGLQQFEVAHVHSELAEQAYRQQVSILPPPARLCLKLLSLLCCVSLVPGTPHTPVLSRQDV
jgi:hypothetical protein